MPVTFWHDARPTLLGVAGLLLTFSAPAHRPDLLAFGGIAVAAALMWRPRTGPLLIGAALPFYFFSRQLVGPLSVSPPGLTLLLAWLGVAVQGTRAKLTLRVPSSSYDAALALFLAAALLGLVVSEYPLLSARELRALIFEPILFFWLLRCMPGSSRLALGGFLSAATLVAIVAVVQVAFGIGGTEAEGVRRAQAWYPSPNHMALMLGRAWPFLLALALGRLRVLAIPAAVVGLAMVLSFSTGAWMGGAMATVVTLGALGRRRLALGTGAALIGGVLLTSALAVVGALPERLNPLRQTSGFRVDLWLSSLQMVRDHPFLGVGLDNFVYQYQNYLREGAVAEPNLSHPHNWILNVWLEMGLPGLISLVWLVFTFARRAAKQRTWLAAGALGAMADMLTHGLIDNSYFLVDLAFLFWLTLALGEEPN
ncbi:MAG TPA: O-antigen ligase family protein [Chloroflexota bacterium]